MNSSTKIFLRGTAPHPFWTRISYLLLWFLLTSNALANEKLILNEWFALGSGCRAKFDLAGDVEAEYVSSKSPDVVKMRIYLNTFNLTFNSQQRKEQQKASECALRIKANPPHNKKITSVTAYTNISVAKSGSLKAVALSELKLGSASLKRQVNTFSEGQVLKDEFINIKLDADHSQPTFPKVDCGQPKIIGFDYSWMVRTKIEDATAQIKLGKKKYLEIEVVLTECKAT